MKKINGVLAILAVGLTIFFILLQDEKKKIYHAPYTKNVVSTQSEQTDVTIASSQNDFSGTGFSPVKVQKNDSQQDYSAQTGLLRNLTEEFNIPADLAALLREAEKTGEVQEEWESEESIENELTDAGLTPCQIAVLKLDKQADNIKKGFEVSDESFEEVLSAAVPLGGTEDDETKALKSDALSGLGFAAMAEHNYVKAEKTFQTIIQFYPDTEAAPMVHLEYARLMLEEGRINEAKNKIDDAIHQYSENKEYIVIAEDLKNFIESYE